jgi:hypothetical protein
MVRYDVPSLTSFRVSRRCGVSAEVSHSSVTFLCGPVASGLSRRTVIVRQLHAFDSGKNACDRVVVDHPHAELNGRQHDVRCASGGATLNLQPLYAVAELAYLASSIAGQSGQRGNGNIRRNGELAGRSRRAVYQCTRPQGRPTRQARRKFECRLDNNRAGFPGLLIRTIGPRREVRARVMDPHTP